jgi:acyl carrier protein
MDDPRADEIIDIISTETRVPKDRLSESAPMDTLGIASLDLVQAIFAVETHFGIELPMAENSSGAEFVTVGDLIRHVLATVDAKNAAAGAA